MTEDKRLALLCQLLSCSGVRVSLPRNPTHGSGWIVQTQPTKTGAPHFPESHPRQWVDRSNPAYKDGRTRTSLNPTHGSGWIVQVLPVTSETTNSSRSCSTAKG